MSRESVFMEAYCSICNKKRTVKRVGGYIFGAQEYPILACQWCRAASTKWKKKYNQQINSDGESKQSKA